MMMRLSLTTSLLFNLQWKNAIGFQVSSPTNDGLVARSVVSSSSTSTQIAAWKNPLEGLFGGGSATTTTTSKDGELRQRLKEELLEKCSLSPRYSNDKRASIEETMQALAPLSPTPASASSPLLQKEWKLVWTSEKEINFFYDWGLTEDVRQTIDGDVLQNNIKFKRAGFFGVTGRLTIPPDTESAAGVRTNFVFESATLNLGEQWGEYTLPPVGEGWFDTIYLDNDMRIDTNSRNDILICIA